MPGNLAIEREIGRRLSEKRLFSLCHVDLDNFKPFADHYGYAWGSEVIKDVGLMLTAILGRQPDPNNGVFVGHIGGDDFVIIADPERAEEISKETVRVFDEQITRFYSNKDRDKGFIIAKDRKGLNQKYPLMTITIAIVTDDGRRFSNPLDMAKKAAALKEYAKAMPGSNYVKEEDFEKEAESGDKPSLPTKVV
ncbi:MAG: RNase II stability modulator [Syntrophus sp. PtaB.Bin001]|nr:MAG: RNase II stability modulator [Syntrophus sp. PtaB.Bin001]